MGRSPWGAECRKLEVLEGVGGNVVGKGQTRGSGVLGVGARGAGLGRETVGSQGSSTSGYGRGAVVVASDMRRRWGGGPSQAHSSLRLPEILGRPCSRVQQVCQCSAGGSLCSCRCVECGHELLPFGCGPCLAGSSRAWCVGNQSNAGGSRDSTRR